MRKSLIVPAMAVLAMSTLSIAPNRSFADEKMGGGKPNADMMKKMEDAGTPGPEHQEMAKTAGDWTADCQCYMNGQPCASMKGTAHFEPLMDGRFMMLKYDGTMNMGGSDMPFKGMGIMGYDKMSKKYFSTWIDSMSTSMMKTEGEKSGNVVTLTGKMFDPMTGKEVTVKEVVTHTDPTHMKYELYAPGPDGKEAKMMQIDYTKKM